MNLLDRTRTHSRYVGLEFKDVDLSSPLSEEETEAIRSALAQYGVVFFRDQHMSPESQLRFARQFAPIDLNRFFKPVDGYPEIAEVLKEPHQTSNIGGGWHTDHSYDEVPAMGSILLAREVPPEGGDTLFINMASVFESLSMGLQRTLEGLHAIHSAKHVFGHDGRWARRADTDGRILNPDVVPDDAKHPMVIKHPTSGRKILYVNPGFTVRIDGWTEAESKALLEYLYKEAMRPEFQCRFQWAKGSIAFWDNLVTWHYALNDYHGHRRLMHRITVSGQALLH
ncbi:MAG: TauD/TfdA family dioxygenase [Betaproteobacteria bacterium]|nr:TauD/TfdA family dioxygenase [Betaproteobacteria bacterium]NBT82593.1 TauD/TfdA family dioxygenase [Betaproteobacteria bacterium]